MTILLINYEYPPIGGGAGRQSQLLSEELSKKHKVIVLTSHYDGFQTKVKVNENLEIVRIPVLRKFLFKVRAIELALFIAKGIVKSFVIARNNQIDLVISFFAVPSGIIAFFLKKVLHIPYIVSLRGFDVPGHLSKEYKQYQKYSYPFIKKVMVSSDRIVTASTYLSALAKKVYPGAIINIIPNAVNKSTVKKEKNSNKAVTILSVGRLNMQKSFIDLIKALALIKSNKKYKLVLVGDGPMRSELERAVEELHLKNIVSFTGWVKRKQLEDIYSKSELFVLPSLEEGMSNVLLEALSFNLPVIAVDIPSNKEIIKNNTNGYLVPAQRADILAEKINIMIENDKLRMTFGLKSGEIAKNFSTAKTTNKYEKIMNEITKGKMPDFKFGKNWLNFTKKYLDNNRINEAEKSLADCIGKGNIKGKTFLDVGCGSGLFSFAAYKLRASKILSFDIDPDSVECCKYLAKRAGSPSNWIIKNGSVLDNNFLKKIGKYDIVYSFGVLHHTGKMKKAIENTSKLVLKNGIFYLGIYNKADNFGIYPLSSFGSSKFWGMEKKAYSILPEIVQNSVDFFLGVLIRIFSLNSKESRGMSWMIDLKDWLGGYPYEYASPDEIFNLVKRFGFSLENLKTNNGLRNNEYLFKKING